ncbi:TetR/AcrR family transcriptional regulator [Halomonas sp. TD01]|uniref:TetR/AcrR family transcriptional regulator n=1 Tax=Halomonas sp. TD01 TaxID=999141 RepID=UPI000214E30E|nr:TetR/AcrR family transcriptional regulator [Halomonas sp. TD01]EGP19325.1 TetR family transcriptional regulator [Halomonas sp. TD01]CAH1045114.1 Transcriptional regulator, AcrR family [Halomonas sp. TD01]
MERREQLVSVAFGLFYRYGVHAIGINRIIAESGVAKKTLYHHFSSKEALIAATVDYRDRQFSSWIKGRTQGAPDGQSAIFALFDALDDWFNEREKLVYPFHGCYFINVSAEFSDLSHPVHQQCASHKRAMLGLISGYISQIFVDEKTVTTLSEAVATLKEGATVQAHVMGDLKAAVKAKAIAKELLRTRLES